MTKAKKHLTLGNLNIDVYIYVDNYPGKGENVIARDVYIGPGGAAANYAVAVARAQHKPFLVAHTGIEAKLFGILDSLTAVGVDVSNVRIHKDQRAGMVFIVVTRDGERTMFTVRGANNLLRGDEARGIGADVIHVASRETDVLARASREDAFVSYDPGGAVARKETGKVLEAAWRHADILYLNSMELRLVAGNLEPSELSRLVKGRLKIIVVKLGARGALAATGRSVIHVEAYKPGMVVDTTGAGDVFAGYFNAFLAEGYSVEEALKAASVAAGIKVSRKGAQSAPDRREVEEVLQSGPPQAWRL